MYRAYDSLLFCLTNPTRVHEGFPLGPDKDTTTIAIALHIYHIFAFKCNLEDYIHHIVSALGVGVIGCSQPWGHIINATNFFICGLPGGINYILLMLRKYELITSVMQKRLDSLLNLLLRWPGIALVMYMAIVGKIHNPAVAVGWIPILAVAVFRCLFSGSDRNISFYTAPTLLSIVRRLSETSMWAPLSVRYRAHHDQVVKERAKLERKKE